MSNATNTILLERANEVMDRQTGTLWERMIDRAIKAGDLESVRYLVNEAEKELALEDSPTIGEFDVY